MRRACRVRSIREAGEHRRRAHVVARLQVLRLRERHSQVARDVLHRQQRDSVGERLVIRHREALDRVRQRVHPGSSSDPGRQLDRQLRVDQRDPRRDVRCAADVELDLAFGIGDDRPQRDLASGARRRRHGDHGRDARTDRAVAPFVVDDAAIVHGDDADPLGSVHRGPAADGDEPVASLRSILGGTRIDELDARVRLDPVEHDRLHVSLAQRLERGLQQARRLDARVRHEQRPADAQKARLVAQLADGAEALHEPSWALVSPECVFQHRLQSWPPSKSPAAVGTAIQPESRGGCGPGRFPGASSPLGRRRR